MKYNKKTYYDIYQSPFGPVAAAMEDEYIVRIVLPRTNQNETLSVLFDKNNKSAFVREPSLFKDLFNQFDKYFAGRLTAFSVKIKLAGTDFQKQVWDAISEVPYGGTASYGDLAKKIGRHKAYRAVGNACNANPIPLIVPCHRIISSSGNMGGFGGGVELKKHLLELEGALLINSV